MAIRLGGLAGLQALIHENAQMYTRVWEYLGSFLRNPPDLDEWKSGVENDILSCRRITAQGIPSHDKTLGFGKRPDIHYITEMLLKRNGKQRKWEEEKEFCLPLYKVHLEKAYLNAVYLEKVNLNAAHLEMAYLGEAQLQEARLRYAHLEEADLRYVQLQKADLSYAHLEGANLSYAHLERTNLTLTDLSQAQNLTPQQFISKKCRYLKGRPPLLPEEWPQVLREQVLASMEVYAYKSKV